MEPMDEIDIDIDIEEIDEELALPGDLVNLNLGAKKELLVFKRSHNEVKSLNCMYFCFE